MPHGLFTVFEDRRQKLTLTEAQAEDIFSFQNVLGKNRLSLSYDGTLQVSHYVGFISKGKTRLQILPKVYEKRAPESEYEEWDAMRVMLNLLRASEFDKILELPEQVSSASSTELMELFISIFAHKIIRTYSQQMNREYIETVEDSPFIKGRIEFVQNLRQNPVRRDRHVVRFQTYEHDNLINNVIKTVCVRLLTMSRVADNKKSLKKALVYLDDAVEIRLSRELINSVQFTRLNMPFKPVYEMAKMFFLNLTPESYRGDNAVFSFLVPLNELFEYNVYKLFDAMDGNIRAQYQNSRSFVADMEGKSKLSIRPDILVSEDNRLVLIADAKYKNPGFEKGEYTNISQADIYQVFAYARAYGISDVALIYPEFDDIASPVKTLRLNDSAGEIRLSIACVDMRCDDMMKNREILQRMIN